VLRRTDSFVRWTPDLIAARGESVCFIDCKANMSGSVRRRHAIERAVVRAHLQLVVMTNLPVHYVFDHLGVATPYDVLSTGQRGITSIHGSGAAYCLIIAAQDRSFDSVVGQLPVPTTAGLAVSTCQPRTVPRLVRQRHIS
jgi:hypothetical protein